MGFEESTVTTFSVSAEEREQVYQRAWDKGGGFRFMFETFCDIATDAAANEEAAKFIRRQISAIVSDPETARKLTPTDLYARRPLCDSGYYETFNRSNVSLVRIDENPISHLTEKGIVTADGTLHEIDVLVCATGFDAIEGNYVRVNIQGRDGESLREHWRDGPTSYLGMATSGFPNLFMILGPNGPFANMPPSIETQVEWIAQTIRTSQPPAPAGSTSSRRRRPPGPTRAWTSRIKRSSRRSPRGSSAPTSPGRSRPSCSSWAG